MGNTLVIVGAGFCGTVLAANLLRRPPSRPTDVVLIERGPAMGRGLAYAARDFPYLLNVPAARLSAESRDPLQFLRFAQQRLPATDGEDFLPRALYGDYLQQVLLQAERDAPAHVRLLRVFGEVRRVARHEGKEPFAAEFAERPAIAADRMILAPGNPAAPLLPCAGAVCNHPAYLHDPWHLPKTLSAPQSVLIVGNGLTMADAVLALSEDSERTPALHTISRRGLMPQPQAMFRPTAMRGNGEALLASAHSMRQVLAVSRAMVREVERLGGDWREVVTFLRNLAPQLWRQLPAAEQRRFVRHLQTYWDVHRHRLPPQLGARLEQLRGQGRLQVNAGRVQEIIAVGRQLQVSWRPRGSVQNAILTVDFLINATGPDYVLKRSTEPLMKSLHAAGLVSEDALNLGLRTAQYGSCVDMHGNSSERLYYLGPMLRADYWEATAATELRNHAEQLAAHLAECGD